MLKYSKFFPVKYILEKIDENNDKEYFLAIMMNERFIGHQSYALLCTETTLITQSYFPKQAAIYSEVRGLTKDSYRNGRNTASLQFWKSETSRDIKKIVLTSFEHL